MNWKKIRITGGSGSGKSYLGKKIASFTNIPLTSMDNLTYDFSNTYRFENKRSILERKKLLAKVMKQKQWILEGGYYSAVKHTYDEADVLIFLRPSFVKRLMNTIERFFKRLFSGKYEGLGNFLSLTKYNFNSIKKWQKERHELFSKKYATKFYSFKSADKAYKWFIENYYK